MKNTRELRTIYANQESFNKKAFVKEDEDGTQYLYSYYSLIITNFPGKVLIFEKDTSLYSNTTMKHVREYLKQIGKGELAALSKSNLFKRLEETSFIVVDIL